VYGQEVVMAMEYIIPNLRITTMTNMADIDIVEERLEQLLMLEEDHFLVGFHQQVQKAREKAWHNHHNKQRTFKSGDLVLMYDSKFT